MGCWDDDAMANGRPALIAEYERDVDRLIAGWSEARRDPAIALAGLPLQIRGFGPVKMAAAARKAGRRVSASKAMTPSAQTSTAPSTTMFWSFVTPMTAV